MILVTNREEIKYVQFGVKYLHGKFQKEAAVSGSALIKKAADEKNWKSKGYHRKRQSSQLSWC